ncbi:MAG: DNA internalization-related competence protein ComEC/Rec2 [Clostridia bacterium]
MAVDLVKAAVCLALGVYSSSKFSAYFLVLFLIFYLLIWLLKIKIKAVCNISSLLLVILFIIGAIYCKIYTNTELKACNQFIDRYVTITGRISEIPVHDNGKFKYVLNVNRVRHGNEEAKIKERILVTSDKTYAYGDTVEFTGFLQGFDEKLNENGFDVLRYYKSKGIFFKMYSEQGIKSESVIRDYSPYAISVGFKNSISQFIDKYNTGDKAAVLKAVLTGNKNELSDDLYAVLRRTGTSRCLYPAYLHVMLIVTAIGMTAAVTKKRYRDMLLIILLILYAVINSYNPVFLRVILLTALTLICKLRYGYAFFSEMVSLTVIVVIFLNPLMLFDGGFVFSVSSVILVKCFYNTVYNYFGYISWRYVRRGLTVGTICSLGLIPLSAYFFGGISLYSAISTLLFIPPVLGIILSFPIVFILMSVFGAAPLVSGFMTVMAYIIMYVPRMMDKLVSSYIILPRPGLVIILSYMTAVAALWFYINKKNTCFKWSVLISAALFTSAAAGQLMRLNTVEVTFVNVGQGDGAIVEVPYRDSIIIDGGGGSVYSDYNIGEKIFLPYLETEGITNIEAALVTHYHKDHTEGVVAAIENLRVRNVFMPDVMPENEYRQAIEAAAKEHNTKIHYISEDSRIIFDSGLMINITVPAAKTELISDDENDTSLLYEVSYGEFNCLFTGDMSDFAERNLIAAGKAVDCDVLKTAHHGSESSTCAEWIEAVSPEYAIISVGRDNVYDLPDKKVLERLRRINVFRTDKNGDIKITAGKNGIKSIESYK